MLPMEFNAMLEALLLLDLSGCAAVMLMGLPTPLDALLDEFGRGTFCSEAAIGLETLLERRTDADPMTIRDPAILQARP